MNKRIGYLVLLLLFFFLGTLSFNKNVTLDTRVENERDLRFEVKSSGFWNLTKFVIDDAGGGDYNWTEAEAELWCSGSGTYSDPYFIENITIDGQGSGTALEIRNSESFYFIIKNCTFFNSSTGIKFYNVSLGNLRNNTVVNNSNTGIHLELSNNNTIEWNNASNIGGPSFFFARGIRLLNSHNNTISKNNASNIYGSSQGYGIQLQTSHDNFIVNNTIDNIYYGAGIYTEDSNNLSIISNNVNYSRFLGIFYFGGSNSTIIKNSLTLCSYGIIETTLTNFIDTTNLVNGKLFYYYVNENYLNSANYSNPGEILLYNCTDSTISDLNITSGSFGIYLDSSSNITVVNVTLTSHNSMGLQIWQGSNNTVKSSSFEFIEGNGLVIQSNYTDIYDNDIYNNSLDGIQLYNYYHKIFNNSISGMRNGISVYSQNSSIHMNNISKNRESGLIFITGGNNTSYSNKISENGLNGIHLTLGSQNNVFFLNNITNNNKTGAEVESGSNIFYNNSFIGNPINAQDNGTNNIWDNGTYGNFWDDYGAKGGYDLDDDKIGDIWYSLDGTANANDTKPLWDDGPENPPVVTITSPNTNDVFGSQAPNFTVTIIDSDFNSSWYALYNGSQWSANYTFIGNETTVNQTAWDYAGDGAITIRVYANDSKGYLGYDDVNITKDLTQPVITIVSPKQNDFIGSNAPNFNLTIVESNLNTTWYRVWNGSWSSEYSFVGATGTLSQTLWNFLNEGILNITFYANDTLNNLGNASVLIIKDSIHPSIKINNPISLGVYPPNAPTFNVEISDINLNTTWYRLTNGTLWSSNYTFTGNGTIDQTAWDLFSNQQITIVFYANDSTGDFNTNTSMVGVFKALSPPNVIIFDPDSLQKVGSTAPSFVVGYTTLYTEGNINTTWYSLYYGSQWTPNQTFSGSGTINQTLWTSVWNSVNHGDIITIRFYGNDSYGYLNFKDVQVKKDDPTGDGTPSDGLDFILFIIIIIIGVAGVVIGVIIYAVKKGGYKTSKKEIDRIESLTI
jgi:parallel beta-helix repeat protein